jgi:hypothetical protein
MQSMNFLAPKNLLPAVALIVAMFFIVSAVPHVTPSGPAAAHRHGFRILMAEVRACEARGERSHDECVDEAQGKALIRRAEWMTRLEAQQGAVRGDDLDDAVDAAESARSPRSGTQ